MSTTMMDHLSWIAYKQRLRDPDAIVLLPVGALSSAQGSTAEKGKRMTDDLCGRIAAALQKKFRHGG